MCLFHEMMIVHIVCKTMSNDLAGSVVYLLLCLFIRVINEIKK